MKTPDSGDELLLTFICKDPSSGVTDDCPALYKTNRGTWMAQGDRRDESQVRAQLRGLKDREGAVELPDALVDLFVIWLVKERYGIDLGGQADGADQQRPEPGQAGAA